MGYTTMNAVEDQLAQLQKKRIINEDDYFDDDELPDKGGDDGYQPAPGSPGRGPHIFHSIFLAGIHIFFFVSTYRSAGN